MALTAKPISTISYNTEPFIRRKMDQLMSAHIINNWMYICHQGEGGDKDHIHLYIEPNRRIDTGILRDDFKEVPSEGDKALGCLPFRSSKVDHWIMYVIHDPDYLKAHSSQDDGDGKIEYSVTDIKCAFEEQRDRDYKRALPLKNTDNQKIINNLNAGKSAVEVAYESDVNPVKIQAIINLFKNDIAVQEVSAYAIQGLMMDIEQAKIDRERENAEIMIRDLERKTGLELREEKPKEKIFDEEQKD